ncbi:MAG: hypothetical protein GY838_15555 [bacterium]|nr:hypothetical protein [bacterium]
MTHDIPDDARLEELQRDLEEDLRAIAIARTEAEAEAARHRARARLESRAYRTRRPAARVGD